VTGSVAEYGRTALIALVTLAVSASAALAVTIHNTTYTDPSNLTFGVYIQGSDGGGIITDPTTLGAMSLDGGFPAYGNNRDWNFLADAFGNAANAPGGLWFDLGGQANQLVVFPIVDHPPIAGESFEYDVFFSPDLVNWTEATLDELYTEGWSGGPVIVDGYTTIWKLPSGQTFRYVSVAWGNPGNPDPSYLYEDGDCEVDAVAGLTEQGEGLGGTTPADVTSWGRVKQLFR
jgi:hypothetical protein